MNAVKKLPKQAPLHKRLAENIRNHPLLYVLALPVVAYYLIFNYYPMYGVLMAFQDFKPALGIWGSKWVGLKHFEKFIGGIYFWRLVRNTLSINLGMLLVGFPIPILFALLLNEIPHRGFQRVTQTVTYMPHFISSVVVCGLMLQFCGSNGILTRMLAALGLTPQTNLFTVPSLFQPLYIGMNVWKNMGWDSIIFFAALTSVDSELHEAAQIDGAGRWRRMLHVTLPAIMPTVVILLIMRIGNLMSLGWDQIILLYNERVYETADVISTYVYRMGLTKFEYSFGSAVGLLNSVINVILLMGANALSRKVNETSLW
ncbi:MAG: ABC transporter permease subunit [Eubacteriales bacterium]|nr:ABC transporter permease subunit [bacterium]MDY2791683.1 ABC transporter permease subunit [Eubacteriales bacterium]